MKTIQIDNNLHKNLNILKAQEEFPSFDILLSQMYLVYKQYQDKTKKEKEYNEIQDNFKI